jgi:hypothetical protein
MDTVVARTLSAFSELKRRESAPGRCTGRAETLGSRWFTWKPKILQAASLADRYLAWMYSWISSVASASKVYLVRLWKIINKNINYV